MKIASKNSRRNVFACIAAFAVSAVSATAVAAPAVAAAADSAPSIRVRYGDLDLATDRGATVLYQRISSAARQVCPDVYSRDLGLVAAGERCRAAAIAQAVHDMKSPQLALVHASHIGHG